MVYEEDENCFLKNGKAFCAPRENGTDIIINLLDGRFTIYPQK